MSLDEHVPPPGDQPGQPGQAGYPGQPGQAAYPGQPAYPAAPPVQQGTSGLAIAGFVLAFLIAPLGFVLSLIAVFRTGAGRKKGRGLAIAGVIISAVLIAGAIAVGVVISRSTVIDPGCVSGKDVIFATGDKGDAASLQKTVDGLNAASAKAKNDDVRKATKALADDYAQLQKATKTGQMPAGIEDKISKDGETFDSLCTISK